MCRLIWVYAIIIKHMPGSRSFEYFSANDCY